MKCPSCGSPLIVEPLAHLRREPLPRCRCESLRLEPVEEPPVWREIVYGLSCLLIAAGLVALTFAF